MIVRALVCLRFIALVAALSILFHTSSTLAASDMVWSFSEGNDASNRGRMTARLGYGVPETDNVQVDGVCEARRGSSVMSASLILGADVGKLDEGQDIKVRFSGGGFETTVSGLVFGTKLEEGITGVSLDIEVRDLLWKALTSKPSLDYQVPGYSASKLNLKSGHVKIRQFIRACRAYAEELGPGKTSEASPKPAKKEQPEKTVEPEKKPAPSGMPVKEAFNSAKELGTLEAWEAFLENFPKGFRSDLARAYVKRLGGTAPKAPSVSAPTTQTPPPPVVETVIAPPPPPSASPADISISTTANQTSCKGGDSCSYTVVASNNGGEAFVGELVIANSLAPRGATLTSTGNTPWFCQGMGGGAICTNPAANIAPGASTNLSLTFKLPRRAGGSVTSCASISWGGVPTASTVRDVQQALNDLGQNVGRPDGKAGRKTRTAIRAYQQQNGLQETGEVDLPLLIAMFTVPGAGDGDPINDQSCTGSSVIPAQTSFIPQPQVSYCGGGRVLDPAGRCACPATYPHWTGKSCLPRRVRNCRGGTYYNKRQRLCLCPSRKPFWHGNRCRSKPLPIPPALNTQQAGCPSTHIRIGNVCVNLGIVPVFGKRRGGRGGGGGTAILPGGGAGGQQGVTGGGKKPKGVKSGGPKTQTQGVKSGKGGAPKPQTPRTQQTQPTPKKALPACKLKNIINQLGKCTCPAGFRSVKFNTTGPAAFKCVAIRLTPRQQPPRVTCQAPAKRSGGKCVCPAGQKTTNVKSLSDARGLVQITQSCYKPKPGGCWNNMILLPGGTFCGCPANLPVKVNSRCFATLPICNPSVVSQSGTCKCGGGYAQQKTKSGGIRCVLGGKGAQPRTKGAKDPFNCGGGRRSDNPTGRCLCPAGLNFIVDSCVQITPAKKFKGKTVCPQGTTIRPGSQDRGALGICIPIAKAQQIQRILQKRKKLQATKCLNNEAKLVTGECTCLENLPYHFERRCYASRAAQQQQQKQQQQRRQQQQQQACPPNTNRVGNRCVTKPVQKQQQACPPNTNRVGNRCVLKPSNRPKPVQQKQVHCPPTMNKIGNRCVPKPPKPVQQQVQCPPTMNRVGNRCVPKPPKPVQQQQQQACPPNMNRVGNRCVPKPPPKPVFKKLQCPPGLIKTPQGCAAPKNCPPGTVPSPAGCINPFSDVRLKQDVEHLATLESGIKLYSFRYLWEDTVRVGVMAQDLLADPARRDAVVLQTSGYYAVDYGMLGLRMVTLDEWKSRGVTSVLLNSPQAKLGALSLENK